MITRKVRVQLVVFVLVAVTALVYGAFRYGGLGDVFNPPYLVRAEFATSGGIYPLADVDLLGTRVGQVQAVHPGPGDGTTVDLRIDHGARIPAAVTATVANKSAIGEQYVELVPTSAEGPVLQGGSVIPLARTATPPPVAGILSHLDSLAASVPKQDLTTDLTEMSTAVGGLGPTLQRLLDQTNALTRTGLDNLHDVTGLIDNAKTVLDTQVAEGPQITTFSTQLAGLTDRLRELDPTVASVFTDGIRAGTETTGLLQDNQNALPALLNNLVSLTNVTDPRLGALRKTLVVYPWVLQQAATTLRYCDQYDPVTGKPVQATCHYDPKTGKPIWSVHVTLQLPENPGSPPFNPCVNGYQGTKKYLPDGTPADGNGPPEQPNSPPNNAAHCAASPGDPNAPNVRGAQNAQASAQGASPAPPPAANGLALYDPNSGIVAGSDGQSYQLSGANGPAPVPGPGGLAWLLTQPLAP